MTIESSSANSFQLSDHFLKRDLQEIIPDPTPESIARDAETEAQVFAQSGSVDRLLAMLSAADAQGSSISDDDELMVS